MAVKIYISDICGGCCPVNVSVGDFDAGITERVKIRTFEKLGLERPGNKKRLSRPVRTAFMLAAIISVLSVSAFAGVRFAMLHERTEEPVIGYWREIDENGGILSEQKVAYPDAGMIFSFEGVETDVNKPEFRCYYLPSEADFGYTDEEGWTGYISDSGEGDSIPYVVSASAVSIAKRTLVLEGKPQVLSEEKRGDWYVMEISSDYSQCSGRYVYESNCANYILMFDEERGWLVTVMGTSGMDTLRRIAENLEIRESEQPRDSFENIESIGMLAVGRG